MSGNFPATAPNVSEALSGTSRWERRFDRAVAWVPYVTLLIGIILSQGGGQPWGDRAITVGLALVAAGWTWTVFTRAGWTFFTEADPSNRDRPWRIRIYFVGFLVLAMLLITREPAFFVYGITGFLHAYQVRPWPLTFLAVGGTSLAVNSPIVIPDANAEAMTTYMLVFTIQTVAIGLGLLGGEKAAEVSEQRRQAVADLEAALEENIGLQMQLVTQAREAGVLDERQRMAREIHDTLAQGLTGVITQLEAVRQARDRPVDLERHLDNAAQLARESLAEARRSVQAIQPAPLDNSRLPEALSEVSSRWSELNEMAVNVTITGTARRLRPDVEATLLRVAQEGLANVAKHAAASRTGVTLSFMEDMVTLDVRDDGVGFSTSGPARGAGGFGLTAMRQRVEGLEGTLNIESGPRQGTAISVTIPTLTAELNHG